MRGSLMLLLSLLGEQPIPNLLPLWQAPQDYTQVRFAATRATLPLAETLGAAIAEDPSLCHLEVLPPLMLEPYHLAQARAQLSHALSEAALQGQAVRLNLTGGTKIMSLAALQAAYGTGAPLLYVSTETQEIIYYASDGREIERRSIRVKISVEQYLKAHGLEVSVNQSFTPGAPPPARPPKEGDQLEEEVFRLALNSGFFDDVRRGLFIRRRGRADYVVNELDIAATRNGRLVVCSCSTVHGVGALREKLYELSAISRREAAGIYCGKVFVSSQENLPPGIKERASAYGIRLVYGAHLAQAAEQMRRAIDPA